MQLAAVAALCVQYEAEFRPNMSIVVKALSPLLVSKQTPTPAPPPAVDSWCIELTKVSSFPFDIHVYGPESCIWWFAVCRMPVTYSDLDSLLSSLFVRLQMIGTTAWMIDKMDGFTSRIRTTNYMEDICSDNQTSVVLLLQQCSYSSFKKHEFWIKPAVWLAIGIGLCMCRSVIWHM